MTAQTALLLAITLLAATIIGSLGYGFSSITVPLALLIIAGRVLNPALVLVEVVLNACSLWVNRRAIATVSRRVLPVVLGLAPGIAIGTAALSRVSPSWLKLATFALLLPLILLQAVGYRRPIRSERSLGAVFGGGVGALYAITTISGPPLAIFLNNQGFAKQEFRAALALIRFVEATLTSIAYLNAGLFTATSVSLLGTILPSVAIGVPTGAWLIRHVRAETFRRVCMSFDAAIVAFGLSKLFRELHLVDSAAAYALVIAVVSLDAVLLYRFFRALPPRAAAPIQPQTS
jgi:uncharacterized membrane protein YfcA